MEIFVSAALVTALGSVMVAVIVCVQELASVIVHMYVPAQSPVAVGVF
jgi:hypothetical protein